MAGELEVIGFPWGRNRSFASSVYAARFRIQKIIRNDALPDAAGFDEVSVPGFYALPSYSPFILYHVVLALEAQNDEAVVKRGVRLFVVKRIIQCRSRPITVATLREFLVSLYDNTYRPDEASLIHVEDWDARKTPTASGTSWFQQVVRPLIRDWPEHGLKPDNRDQLLSELKQRCAALEVDVITVNVLNERKRKRGDVNMLRASSVYAVLASRVKPCARGDVFEELLKYFHEAVLLSLDDNQQRVLLEYVYDRPTSLLFWPSFIDLIRKEAPFKSDSNGGRDVAMALLALQGRSVNVGDFQARLTNTTSLSFDPAMPAWSWPMFQQAATRQDSTVTADAVAKLAFRIYLNIERHLYYTNISSAVPRNPGARANYLQQLLECQSTDHNQAMQLLLQHNAVKLNDDGTLVQPKPVFDQELEFVKLINKVSSRTIFVDAEPCCSLLFLRQWADKKVLPPLLQDDGATEICHTYACNQAFATFASPMLTSVVYDIFSPPTTESVLAEMATVSHLCILMAHKIPLATLVKLIKMYKKRQTQRRRPLRITFVGDGGDYVNANFPGQAFIRFADCVRLINTVQSDVPVFYVTWAATQEVARTYRGAIGDSVTAFVNVTLQRQSSLESTHMSLTVLFDQIKALEMAQRKSNNRSTYAVLCSNYIAKNTLLQRMAGANVRFHADTFMLKQMVFVESTNSRGLLEDARVIDGNDYVMYQPITATTELNLRRGVYDLTIDGNHYRTDTTRLSHSTIDTVSNYVGTPVQTLILVVTEHTTMADVKVASRYALSKFVLYYSYETTFATIKRNTFTAYNDLANKLAATVRATLEP
jgi:hypothetical protein